MCRISPKNSLVLIEGVSSARAGFTLRTALLEILMQQILLTQSGPVPGRTKTENSMQTDPIFNSNFTQPRTKRSLFAITALRAFLLMALSTGPAYGAGDMVSNFLTSVVSLITSTWAIAIVVIATFYVGYLFFFSDRRTHEHLSGWLFGCIFVLGCQVLAQQFIH
jgi:hypothetical protein